MDEAEFKRRTHEVAQVRGKQLLRCGTSIGANYRAACRGKSAADVTAKLGIVEEEADETLFWLQLISESGLLPQSRLDALAGEVQEIVRMTVASIRTLRSRANPKSKIQNPK